MSDLVFVRDAQGRPLMPMSAAYARTLIRNGKAHLQPHPTLTIIQLTRAVASPVLRPVILGLRVHKMMIELIILVDQARASTAHFRIVVDLQPNVLDQGHPLLSTRKSNNTSTRRLIIRVNSHRRSQSRRFLRRSNDWRRQALEEVIVAIQQFVPISHLVVLPFLPMSAPPRVMRRWLERRLIDRVVLRTNSISLITSHDGVQQNDLLQLYQILVGLALHKGELPPLVVARYIDAFKGLPLPFSQPQWQATDTEKADHDMDDEHSLIGRLCTIHQQNDSFTGLIGGLSLDGGLELHVPVAVEVHRVIWEVVQIDATTRRRLWDATSVVLMPIRGAS